MLLRLTLLTLILAGSLLRAVAAEAPSAVQLQRAEKITATLGLTDSTQAARVSALIAGQYQALAVIHTERNRQIAEARQQTGTDKSTTEAAVLAARTTAEAAQARLHTDYLARLAAELTPAQIDQVKDGMTYGVLPLTFRVYQEMLPNLTAEQKAQLLAWLTEAREHAMDASTSEEKHGWFGKYKGRINNYLSKAGIDMKQAEKDLQARKKTSPQ